MDRQISLLKIFAVFAKIGAFTIGGGYMMVPAIQNEMSRRGWISLPTIVQYSSLLPPVGVWSVSQYQCGGPSSQNP